METMHEASEARTNLAKFEAYYEVQTSKLALISEGKT